MQQIINLLVDLSIWVLGWTVVHPPFINVVINVIFIDIWCLLPYKAIDHAFTASFKHVPNSFALDLFSSCNHLPFKVSKKLFSDMFLFMINNDFHMDITLNISILSQYGHPSVLFIFSLLTNRLIVSLAISLADLTCISNIEQIKCLFIFFFFLFNNCGICSIKSFLLLVL